MVSSGTPVIADAQLMAGLERTRQSSTGLAPSRAEDLRGSRRHQTLQRGADDSIKASIKASTEPMVKADRTNQSDLNASICRFQENGDVGALQAIMESSDWIAVACARRMQRSAEPLEDLEQVAREALIGAAARFDPDRGVLFKSFAWATAIGALRHHYRSRWQVRVPRGLQELHLATVRALAELTAAGVSEPTVDVVALHLGVSREEVVLALDVRHAYLAASLDHRMGDDRDDSFDRVLGCVDHAIEATADRVNLRDMLESLRPAQRTALMMHYFEGRTQAEVGVALGVSQAQVSRLMRSALAALRDRLGESGGPDS